MATVKSMLVTMVCTEARIRTTIAGYRLGWTLIYSAFMQTWIEREKREGSIPQNVAAVLESAAEVDDLKW
jgi:hypothetical protein